MAKVQIQVNNSIQHLLGDFTDMPLHDLESVIRELNALVVRKRANDKEKKDKSLLQKINQTVLPEQMMERYIFLQEKMELEEMPNAEYQELLNLVTQEEKIRNKRFQFLLELAQLRNISLTDLMNSLGLNTPHYA
jgi:hypothetical protein